MRLIKGELDYSCRIGHTRIGIVPLEAPAPQVEAVVVEQDTHGLLAVEPLVVEPLVTPAALTTQLAEFVPYKGGGLVVKSAKPLQLYAIVHDLDLTPSWREEWIVSALDAMLKLAVARSLKRLGLAPLGTVHGRFPLERLIQLLVKSVAQCPEGPEQIWLGVKRRLCRQAVEYLKQCCATHQCV